MIEDAWALARCGHVTASEFSSVLAKGQGKTRASYLRRVVAEMLTGKPCDTYRNRDMERGLEQEPLARLEYEARTGNVVQEFDRYGIRLFIKHPSLPIGCSPDGLIDADGGGEFKSVIPTVQIETILSGGYPAEHKPQVQGTLWLSERAWWDYGSFCPDMPTEDLRLYIFRIERDEDYIKRLETEVSAFAREAMQLRDTLLGRDTLANQLRASIAEATA
jgi:hypothetical protein